MPQSSDDMRDMMTVMFGDFDCVGPERFLLSRGYTLTRGWEWHLPSEEHYVTPKEELCVRFLVEEWDYGYIKYPGYYYPG